MHVTTLEMWRGHQIAVIDRDRQYVAYPIVYYRVAPLRSCTLFRPPYEVLSVLISMSPLCSDE